MTQMYRVYLRRKDKLNAPHERGPQSAYLQILINKYKRLSADDKNFRRLFSSFYIMQLNASMCTKTKVYDSVTANAEEEAYTVRDVCGIKVYSIEEEENEPPF